MSVKKMAFLARIERGQTGRLQQHARLLLEQFLLQLCKSEGERETFFVGRYIIFCRSAIVYLPRLSPWEKCVLPSHGDEEEKGGKCLTFSLNSSVVETAATTAPFHTVGKKRFPHPSDQVTQKKIIIQK